MFDDPHAFLGLHHHNHPQAISPLPPRRKAIPITSQSMLASRSAAWGFPADLDHGLHDDDLISDDDDDDDEVMITEVRRPAQPAPARRPDAGRVMKASSLAATRDWANGIGQHGDGEDLRARQRVEERLQKYGHAAIPVPASKSAQKRPAPVPDRREGEGDAKTEKSWKKVKREEMEDMKPAVPTFSPASAKVDKIEVEPDKKVALPFLQDDSDDEMADVNPPPPTSTFHAQSPYYPFPHESSSARPKAMKAHGHIALDQAQKEEQKAASERLRREAALKRANAEDPDTIRVATFPPLRSEEHRTGGDGRRAEKKQSRKEAEKEVIDLCSTDSDSGSEPVVVATMSRRTVPVEEGAGLFRRRRDDDGIAREGRVGVVKESHPPRPAAKVARADLETESHTRYPASKNLVRLPGTEAEAQMTNGVNHARPQAPDLISAAAPPSPVRDEMRSTRPKAGGDNVAPDNAGRPVEIEKSRPRLGGELPVQKAPSDKPTRQQSGTPAETPPSCLRLGGGLPVQAVNRKETEFAAPKPSANQQTSQRPGNQAEHSQSRPRLGGTLPVQAFNPPSRQSTIHDPFPSRIARSGVEDPSVSKQADIADATIQQAGPRDGMTIDAEAEADRQRRIRLQTIRKQHEAQQARIKANAGAARTSEDVARFNSLRQAPTPSASKQPATPTAEQIAAEAEAERQRRIRADNTRKRKEALEAQMKANAEAARKAEEAAQAEAARRAEEEKAIELEAQRRAKAKAEAARRAEEEKRAQFQAQCQAKAYVNAEAVKGVEIGKGRSDASSPRKERTAETSGKQYFRTQDDRFQDDRPDNAVAARARAERIQAKKDRNARNREAAQKSPTPELPASFTDDVANVASRSDGYLTAAAEKAQRRLDEIKAPARNHFWDDDDVFDAMKERRATSGASGGGPVSLNSLTGQGLLARLNARPRARQDGLVAASSSNSGSTRLEKRSHGRKLGAILPEDLRLIKIRESGLEWPQVVEAYKAATGIQRSKETHRGRYKQVKSALDEFEVDDDLLEDVTAGDEQAIKRLNVMIHGIWPLPLNSAGHFLSRTARQTAQPNRNVGEILPEDVQIAKWRDADLTFAEIVDEYEKLTGKTTSISAICTRYKQVKAALDASAVDADTLDRVASGDSEAQKQLNLAIQHQQGASSSSSAIPSSSPLRQVHSDNLTELTVPSPQPGQHGGTAPHPTTAGKTMNEQTFRYLLESRAEAYCAEDNDTETDQEDSDHITEEDYCHFYYQVQRREISAEEMADDHSIENMRWIDCGKSYDNSAAANKAVPRWALVAVGGRTAVAGADDVNINKRNDEDGRLAMTVSSDLGIVEVRVDRRVRTFQDGSLPQRRDHIASRTVYLIKEVRTKHQTADDVDMFGNDFDACETLVRNSVYSTLDQANACAVEYLLDQTLKPTSSRLEIIGLERKEAKKQLLEEIGRDGLFSKVVEADGVDVESSIALCSLDHHALPPALLVAEAENEKANKQAKLRAANAPVAVTAQFAKINDKMMASIDLAAQKNELALKLKGMKELKQKVKELETEHEKKVKDMQGEHARELNEYKVELMAWVKSSTETAQAQVKKMSEEAAAVMAAHGLTRMTWI